MGEWRWRRWEVRQNVAEKYIFDQGILFNLPKIEIAVKSI